MKTSHVSLTGRNATRARRAPTAIALLLAAGVLAAVGASAATCPTCDDGNPCTDDLCDVNVICVHSANSSACNDGNSCTTGDVCNAGSCVGGAPAGGCTACQAESVISAEGGVFTGTTSGASSLTGTCSSTAGSPERVYRWTPSRSGQARIETCGAGTTYDTVVYLRTGNCSTGQGLACNDDVAGCTISSGAAYGSRLTTTVTAGQTYWIVVDGWQGQSGGYTLRVTPPTVCGNGIREGIEACDGADAADCVTEQCTTACNCVPPPSGLPDLLAEIADVTVQRNATVSAGDVVEGCAETTSGVDLLRFTVRSRNAGTADFFLGNPGCPSPCDQHPLEVCSNAQFVCSPAEGHNHAHYNNYARYELLDAGSQAVVVGHKQGFCLLDSICAAPKYTCANQGITAGCADVYHASLGCQYLDVSGVPAGNYVLRVTVDPFNRIAELSESNNVASVPVTLSAGSTTTTSAPPTTTSTTLPTSACASPTVIPANGGSFTGTTSGSSTLSASCASTTSAPERVFAWTPARSGVATIETCDTAATRFDTVLSMRLGACAGGVQIGCNDNTHRCGTAARPNSGSRLRPNVTAGQTYFIIVDGTGNNRSGPFQLRVVPPL